MFPRLKDFCAVLCVLLLTASISASVLKEAVEEHLKDIAHDEGVESLKQDKQKGEKIHQIESQINDSHKNQYSKANDEAKYLKKDHDTKSNSESDAYEGHNSQRDKAESSNTAGYKKGHKKGHHKQGFQNSYHKDESSNKSTFFDDLNDEGDQAAYNSKLNSHDNHGGRNYQGSNNKGQEYVRDDYQGGGYDRYGDHGNKHIGHQDYGKNYYLNDNLNHNKFHDDRNLHDRSKVHDTYDYKRPVYQDRGWQQWDERRDWDRPVQGWNRDRGWERDPGWKSDNGWKGDNGWERDYGGPGYYDDRGFRHEGGYGYGPNYGYGYDESRADPVAQVPVPKNAPVIAQRKQTITIYEDPRYDGQDKGSLKREEGDYLNLDFKPSGQRYASYDDTYYAPSREGRVESSKVNRLVYNYRRQ